MASKSPILLLFLLYTACSASVTSEVAGLLKSDEASRVNTAAMIGASLIPVDVNPIGLDGRLLDTKDSHSLWLFRRHRIGEHLHRIHLRPLLAGEEARGDEKLYVKIRRLGEHCGGMRGRMRGGMMGGPAEGAAEGTARRFSVLLKQN